MKKFKKILLWIIIGVFIETSFLWYLDKYILDNNINVKITKLEHEEKEEGYNTKANIPLEAKDINISPEGSYISYLIGEKLNIVHVEKGVTESLPVSEKSTILDYAWVENRTRILILEQQKEKNSNRINISYYDVKKHVKQEIAHLFWTNEQMVTGNIAVSSVIEMVYVNIVEKGKSRVYSVDLMKNVKELDLGKINIGNMLVTKDNTLLYENLENSVLMQYNKGEIRNVCKLTDGRLWTLDDKENIYVYAIKNSKVSQILYIDNKDNLNNMKNLNLKKINLDKEYDLSSIYVKDNGEVYVKEANAEVVREYNSNKAFKYKGEFIGFYKHGFLYKDNIGNIKKEEIK
ncbi:hypothetical protein [Haloimpatiens massiliensis]|uniref:hypothetical protein n=1 Tax=Haloimpatiens massiliensis TaxID=1658110 RepID=UPI000C81B06C|nr:hypothetical protein [Haloimpatiens massiliensis]